MPSKREQLVEKLRNKEYRDARVASEIASGIPAQIRAMKTERGWTQEQLAHAGGMKQESIARWLRPDYANYSLNTLKRLASAFDVALIVRFAPFSEFATYILNRSYGDLAVPKFDDDAELSVEQRPDSTARQAAWRSAGTWSQLSLDLPSAARILPFKRERDHQHEDRSFTWSNPTMPTSNPTMPRRSRLRI